jgi:hypothetical protein
VNVSKRTIPFNLPLVISGLIVLPALMALLVACTNENDKERLPATISGVVVGTNGPVADAIVQVQGTPNQTKTDAGGRFTLHGEGLGVNIAVTITAWAQNHFIAWTALDPQQSPEQTELRLSLKPLFDGDNHQYTWFSQDGVSGSASCGLCHREYKEWQADSHSQSALNPRFVSMFRGSNVAGKRGQHTQMVSIDKALPPDPNQPYYGPGFRLDFPEYAGTCAACHTPVAGKTPTTNTCAWSGCHTNLTADKAESLKQPDIRGIGPVGLMGVAEEGVTCEFCHVINGVTLDPKTNLPPADAPGIMSLHVRRPPNGHKQFFGTLTDSSREEVTYSPFMQTSQFCSACHFGVFGGVVSNMKMTGGTVIYNSYGEWLDSPYSNPDTGKTCQDCHMPTKDAAYSVFPEKGGVARPPGSYHDHTMPGGNSQALLWSAVTMTPTVTRDGDLVRVQVQITNDKTGHAVPTDAPMRSVMLVVEALDANGQPLPLQQGPTLPEWTGDYAGRAGKGFARILQDNWTGEAPTSAFWRQTTVLEDTRLFPFKTDVTDYAFSAQIGAGAKVNVKLVYRRAFQKLAQQKGWNDPDMTMAEMSIEVK